MVQENALDQKVDSFGRDIFSRLGKSHPSALNRRYWAGRIMRWAMENPEFKLRLFRLVDVLPALRKSDSVGEHVKEYLGDLNNSLEGFLGLALKAKSYLPNFMHAFLAKRMVKEMAEMFIAGESPKDSLPALITLRRRGFAFTVDLLGEFCLSEEEAQRYLDRYLEALKVLSSGIMASRYAFPIIEGHPAEKTAISVSVKLTALYSQSNALNFKKSVDVLSERLSILAKKAGDLGVSLCVDAEDSFNNPIIYRTFLEVFQRNREVPYPCIVIQAYSKESEDRVKELLSFAEKRGTPISIRLVKGAYWDYEKAICTQSGWEFPLFSRKSSTDLQYEKLTRLLLEHHKLCLPAFASHNVRSLSHACCYAEKLNLSPRDFEIQMLYGMAEPVAAAFRDKGFLVRLYVPLGDTIVGMGYLVRRLLENTSNESFLKHTFVDSESYETLLSAPKFED